MQVVIQTRQRKPLMQNYSKNYSMFSSMFSGHRECNDHSLIAIFLIATYFYRIIRHFCNRLSLKACAQKFRYALFAFIHTETYFEYYTLTLRLASLVKKAVIYAYWTKELFDICRENVSYMATVPSVARHVIHADNLRPRH